MNSSKPGSKKSPRPRRSKTAAADQLSRDQIILALEKKKRCNARAQLIVEEFIDPVTDTERFLDKLQYISQCHYDDVVEERFIELLCGYPMCSEKLTDIPKQQYLVSRATNQVYDITERKKFCCVGCFRASNFIRVQLLTSPLWARDHESVPVFKLMDEWKSPSTTSMKNNVPRPLEIEEQMKGLNIHETKSSFESPKQHSTDITE